MEKEFSEFNGYPIKDLVARAEIELLKKKALTFKVVTELPTEDIQENTIYLKPTGQTGSNKYTAHLYVNGEWEDFETVVEFDDSQYAKMLTAGTGKNYDYVVCLFDGLGKQSGRELATTLVAMDKAYTIPVYWNNTVLDANQIPKAVIPVGTPVYAGHAANKKYVDDTAVKRVTETQQFHSAYGYNNYTKKDVNWGLYADASSWTIPIRNDDGQFKVGDLTESSDPSYVANKKYVDEQIQALKTQLGI